jgi:hypothetical protein
MIKQVFFPSVTVCVFTHATNIFCIFFILAFDIMAEEQPDRASTADDALALQTGSTSVVSSDANAPADSLMDNKKRRRESSPLQEFQHEPPNKRRFDH